MDNKYLYIKVLNMCRSCFNRYTNFLIVPRGYVLISTLLIEKYIWRIMYRTNAVSWYIII